MPSGASTRRCRASPDASGIDDRPDSSTGASSRRDDGRRRARVDIRPLLRSSGACPATDEERAQLSDSAFAYIDSSGKRRLPIDDEATCGTPSRASVRSLRGRAARDQARNRLLRRRRSTESCRWVHQRAARAAAQVPALPRHFPPDRHRGLHGRLERSATSTRRCSPTSGVGAEKRCGRRSGTWCRARGDDVSRCSRRPSTWCRRRSDERAMLPIRGPEASSADPDRARPRPAGADGDRVRGPLCARRGSHLLLRDGGKISCRRPCAPTCRAAWRFAAWAPGASAA